MSTFAVCGALVRRVVTPWLWVVVSACGCNASETAFANAYWDNQRQGLYVDAVNGEPLFSSRDKFDFGAGFPTFTQPIEPERVVTKSDWSFGTLRTQLRARGSDLYLGHLFDDGPAPTGLRYHIDSAALRFIALEELESHGYDEYRTFFPSTLPAKGTAD